MSRDKHIESCTKFARKMFLASNYVNCILTCLSPFAYVRELVLISDLTS